MKKFVTILLSIITFIFLIFISYWIIQGIRKTNERLKETKILREEVNILYELDWKNKSVDMNIKSKGESSRLEKIIKEYYNELYQYRKEYDSTNIYSLSAELLAGKNLKDADLNQSKQLLINNYEKNKVALQRIIELISVDYILSLMENEKIDNYYFKLYKELMISNETDNLKQEWIEQKNKVDGYYKLTLDALNVLNNNKNAWYVENNKVYFYNKELLTEYNNIIKLMEESKI